MNDNVLTSAYQHPLLTAEAIDRIVAAHESVTFTRGELFLERGQTAREYYLVVTGLLRSYVHDPDGKVITTNFYGEGEFAIEESSLFQSIPTRETIVSETGGTAWRISFDKFQELFLSMEGFREWGRSWLTGQLFIARQRSLDLITLSATDRYLALMRSRPEIIRQATVKDIATYLGITDTSLSRIRKEIR